MGQQYEKLDKQQVGFIEQQQMFFVGSAPNDGRVNISPKGMDAFRILDESTVAWLNVTGSGNETAAHVLENGRMTIMFCAFEGKPKILRLYGTARVYHHYDAEWEQVHSHFNPIPGARQIFVLDVDMVQSSCGMGVPLFDYQSQRGLMEKWAENRGEDGIKAYWEEKNTHTIDGKATQIFEK